MVNPTCFKSSDNPRTKDLILTNKKRSFTGSSTVETVLSDFHIMIFTVLKCGFVKKGPKIVYYRDFSKYDNKAFKRDLHLICQKATKVNLNMEPSTKL